MGFIFSNSVLILRLLKNDFRMRYTLITVAFISSSLMSQTLDKSTFIERLFEVHPFFVGQDLTSKIKRIDEASALATDEWTLGVNSQLKNETDSISSTYDDLNTHTLNVSASKSFANNGAKISLSQGWTEKRNDIESSNKKFALDYTIPLWKNKDGINLRMDADIANIEILIDGLDKQEKREQFILEKLKKFIDLSYAQEQKSINEQRLILAAEELDLTTRKYEASIVDMVDLLSQKEAFLKSKQQLLESEQELILLQHEIAILLELDSHEVYINFDLYKEYYFDIEDLRSYIFDNSRTAKIANLNKKVLQRQLLSLENKLEPDLDVNFGLSSESNGTTYLNVLQGFNPAFTVGIDLTYPIGDTKGLSSVAKNQISIDRQEQQKMEQLLSIYSQAKVLKEKIILLSEMIESNRAQIEIAKERATQEKYRYDNSNIQASLVISSQNNEQNAILNLAKTAKNYQKAVLDYRATIDSLLP